MVNQGAKKRTLDTSPISGASSLPATYFHDVIYITSFVQLMSIISDKFWYTYLVIPAFGEYKSFRFIRGFLSSVSEGEVEDEKTRKKREKMEKKASRPKFVKARNRYWAIRLGHSTLPWTSSDCFNTSGGSVAAVEESPINFFKRLTWNTGWSFEEFEQSRFAYKATASGTGPSGWATPLCLGPPQSASTHQDPEDDGLLLCT
ncbi:uncharacterized protein LOC120150353 isoform X2 [Hibiscus syriacus]|uniref:uncharacterized protein LOC120150353 isoform X2 n=1 Tax=Hibiscus syriacus TaxID=106335 RepID=UPI0019230D35|nr:uncharacterized protein LOC120150353 isoform X2 [Hibiscus syriacus]